MHEPFSVLQYCVPVRPCGQPCRKPTLQSLQFVSMQATPRTSALQGWDSVEGALAEHVLDMPALPAEHVGVVHARVCVPLRSQVPTCVCMHVPHAPHEVAPHAAPVGLAAHPWVSTIGVVAHVPLAQTEVVTVRVCVPVVPQVAPTEQSDQGVIVGSAHVIPSVTRVQSMDSLLVVSTHAPDAHAEVVTVRVWWPSVVQGSVPKSHAPNSPYAGAAHCRPSVDARVQASLSVVGGRAMQVPREHV